MKHEVREAEASSERKDVVASLLRTRRRTAPISALLLGSAILALLWKVTVPELDVLHQQHVVRANVAAGLAAVLAAAAAGRGRSGRATARFRADPITPRSRRTAARHSSKAST